MIECFFRFSSTFRRWSISCTSRRCPASVASAPLSPTWPPSGPSARRTPSTTTTGWQDWSCNFKISLLLLTYDWLHPTFLRAGAQPMKFSFFFCCSSPAFGLDSGKCHLPGQHSSSTPRKDSGELSSCSRFVSPPSFKSPIATEVRSPDYNFTHRFGLSVSSSTMFQRNVH